MKKNIMSKFIRSSTVLGLACAASLSALWGGSSAQASVIDLGAAGGYSVLTYNSSNVSDSAFQSAPIGVVNGNWTQSGGQQTNTQQATTVFLSTGFTNSGPAVETTVYNNAQLTAAWSAAQAVSSSLGALAPTQVLGAITANTTITESAVGNYVLSISNINLNHTSLTLNAPAGSTFVLNISGDVTINGANGSGLLLAGGLTSSDVVYNFVGGGTLTTSGGMSSSGGTGGSQIQGIILDPNGTVSLHPGGVTGEVVAGTYSSSSASQVTGVTPPPSIPEASALIPLLGVLGLVIGGPTLRKMLLPA